MEKREKEGLRKEMMLIERRGKEWREEEIRGY